MIIEETICDLCHKNIDMVGGTIYQLTLKRMTEEGVWDSMDVCKNCMKKIRKYIDANKETPDEVEG